MTASNLITSTAGNDVLKGTAAVDVFEGSKGNDHFDGGDAGYNQVDYDGAPSDYTFTKNADGTVTVKKPNGGTDTLKNIGGFWFKGAACWMPLDKALAEHGVPGSTPSGSTINGTAGDDYLSGTSGNDVIHAGLGRDVIRGSLGSDTINGGDAGYNQVDYAGAPSDYKFVKNADGSVTVTKPNGGVDTLTNIGGFWFEGAGVWCSLDQVLAGSGTGGSSPSGTINGTAGDDYMSGTSGNDVFNAGLGKDVIRGSAGSDMIDGGDAGYNQVDYEGALKDYTISKNADGTFTVKKPDGGVDSLKNIGGLWFCGEGKWYPIEDAVKPTSTNDTNANDDSADTDIGTPVTINVLGNDNDAQGDAQSIKSYTNGANGTVTMVNGQLVYTPKAGFSGNDTFTYTVVDAKGATDTATVTVCIEGNPQPGNTASIGDKVWFDANKDGYQDAGENGVAGVTVQLHNAAGAIIATTTTDAEGNYLFEKLPAGNYSVSVVKPNGYDFTAANVNNNGSDTVDSDVNVSTGSTGAIALADGQAIRTVDAGLVEKTVTPPANTASIGDKVWLDANKNGVQDAGETGVSGVTVQLKDASGAVVASQVTNASGDYLFDKLAAGNYSVNVVKPNGYDFTGQDAFGNGADGIDSDVNASGSTGTITLKDGEAIRTVDVGVVVKDAPATSSIGDKVWLDANKNGLQDAGEAGVAGVTMQLKDASGTVIATTTTNAQGEYLFDGLKAGDYTVKGISDAYMLTTQDAFGNGADGIDSDFNVTTGETAKISLGENQAIRTVDAGVIAKNTGPVGNDDSAEVCGTNAVTIDVLKNDTDANGDKLSVTGATSAFNGTVKLNDDGTFTYTPKAGYTGTDSFTYTVSDGKGGEDTATVTVDVEKPNNATITGASTLLEGGIDTYSFRGVLAPGTNPSVPRTLDDTVVTNGRDKQNYNVTLDHVADEDTILTIKITDLTANHAKGVPTYRDLSYTNDLLATLDSYAGVGTTADAGNKDFTVYDAAGNAVTGDTFTVIVKAGQTVSESFSIQAWQEVYRASGDFVPAWFEGAESFKLEIVGSSDACISGSDKTIEIGDKKASILSPIMLDLNDDGHIGVTGETTAQDKSGITSVGHTVSFDLNADGVKDQIEWSDGKGDGFLVNMTKIGANGEIDGSALFGDEGGKFANGFEKLALHDANGDGMIMGAELDGFGVWIDNGDAILQDGELKSAVELNITSVSADMQIVYDDAGRALMQATAEVNGETILTEDVWFAADHQPDYIHHAGIRKTGGTDAPLPAQRHPSRQQTPAAMPGFLVCRAARVALKRAECPDSDQPKIPENKIRRCRLTIGKPQSSTLFSSASGKDWTKIAKPPLSSLQ